MPLIRRGGGIPCIAAILFLIFFISWVLLPSSLPAPKHSPFKNVNWLAEDKIALPPGAISQELLHGEGIMPKLGNETLKAELGRASWKLFHTMLARYPLKPTDEERGALKAYIYLFARLYPCGECGTHFRGLLKQFPPQTSSRDAASQWGCFVHNQVNERLKKPPFDCTKVTETYKCGCADADEKVALGGGKKSKVKPDEDLLGPLPAAKDRKNANDELPAPSLPALKGVRLETEGLTRGG